MCECPSLFCFSFFCEHAKPKDVRVERAPAVMKTDCTSGGRGGSGARDLAAWLDLLSSHPQWQPIIRQRAGGQIWEIVREVEGGGARKGRKTGTQMEQAEVFDFLWGDCERGRER